MRHRPPYRRVVLGLQQRTSGPSIEFAAELARLLGLDLFGLFVEDTELMALAGLPFAREISTLGGGWRPLDVARLSEDLALVARTSERRLAAVARRLETNCRFVVARGPAAATLADISSSDDIVIVAEPADPAELATRQFTALLKAAFGSRASVMLVPRRLARQSGAIVAVATSAGDPSIGTAAAIAAAADTDLVVVVNDDGGMNAAVGDPAAARGRDPRIIHAGRVVTARDAAALAALLGPVRERLLVITRGSFDDRFAADIAARRAVPVLVIEPAGD